MKTISEERRIENNSAEDESELAEIKWWERWIIPFGVLLASVVWGLAIFGALELFV